MYAGVLHVDGHVRAVVVDVAVADLGEIVLEVGCPHLAHQAVSTWPTSTCVENGWPQNQIQRVGFSADGWGFSWEGHSE